MRRYHRIHYKPMYNAYFIQWRYRLIPFIWFDLEVDESIACFVTRERAESFLYYRLVQELHQ